MCIKVFCDLLGLRKMSPILRDKGDGFPGAGCGDVGGEENGIDIIPCFFQMWWRNCEEMFRRSNS